MTHALEILQPQTVEMELRTVLGEQWGARRERGGQPYLDGVAEEAAESGIGGAAAGGGLDEELTA